MTASRAGWRWPSIRDWRCVARRGSARGAIRSGHRRTRPRATSWDARHHIRGCTGGIAQAKVTGQIDDGDPFSQSVLSPMLFELRQMVGEIAKRAEANSSRHSRCARVFQSAPSMNSPTTMPRSFGCAAPISLVTRGRRSTQSTGEKGRGHSSAPTPRHWPTRPHSPKTL